MVTVGVDISSLQVDSLPVVGLLSFGTSGLLVLRLHDDITIHIIIGIIIVIIIIIVSEHMTNLFTISVSEISHPCFDAGDFVI